MIVNLDYWYKYIEIFKRKGGENRRIDYLGFWIRKSSAVNDLCILIYDILPAGVMMSPWQRRYYIRNSNSIPES